MNYYRTPGDRTLRGCCLPGSQKGWLLVAFGPVGGGDKVVIGRIRGLQHGGQRSQSTDSSGLLVRQE